MANNFYARFNFCGGVTIPKKREWVKTEEVNYGRPTTRISMTFGVKDGGNCVFVSSTDFKNDTIRAYDVDGNQIEIAWADRFDSDIVDKVSRKYIVDLGERHEFITKWDMIQYLEEHLPSYEGDVVVTGQFTRRGGTGKNADKFYDNFDVNSVYAAAEGRKHRFRMNLDLYFTKDCIDKSSLKDGGKIRVNTYVPMRSRKDNNEMKFHPITIMFNTLCYDFNNEVEKKRCDMRMRYFTVPKNMKVGHMMWEIAVLNGAEEKQFDESCLTDAQRELIELGVKELNDFRPHGSIYGERLQEYRFVDPVLDGDFSNGWVDSGFTVSEFEEQIYTPEENISLSDEVSKAKKSKTSEPSDRDLSDMF